MSVRANRNAKIKSLIQNVIIFVITFILILVFFHFIRFPLVDGSSMSPLYSSNDRLVTLYTKHVSHDDIVILWSDSLDEYLVKRVIGMSGDHIEIKDGILYRNGVQLYESYLKEQSWNNGTLNIDIIVPDNCIYVLGDNRNDSTDSRVLGSFSCDEIFGKVIYRMSW